MSLKDFQILNKLGSGSYSSVYRVRRLTDNQEYALKKVNLTKISDKEKQYALDEVRILASIQNPYLIGYKEAFVDEASSSLCIVMEYADDGDLISRLAELSKKESRMDEAEIWEKFIQLVTGLKALHDLQICHRDLKSANIFLMKDGTVKIGDMNVSKVANKGLLHTQTGTPYYASPEVWKDQPYDTKSDIWSLGCVLYEMAALKTPFYSTDIDTLYNKIIKGQYPKLPSCYSQELSNVIRSLLQVSPHLRPNCDKILQILTNLKKINEKHKIDQCEPEKNVLLSTIIFPKNLKTLPGKLPRANYYSPLRTRIIDSYKGIHTFGGSYTKRKDDSSEDLIRFESDDELRAKKKYESIDRDRSSLPPLRDTSREKHIEKSIFHPGARNNCGNGNLEGYNVESEILRLKKRRELRRLKDEEDRKRLEHLLQEKELRDKNHGDTSFDNKLVNMTCDSTNYTHQENTLKPEYSPDQLLIPMRKYKDLNDSFDSRNSNNTPERVRGHLNPLINLRLNLSSREKMASRSLSRGRNSSRESKRDSKGHLIALHALANNLKETVGEEFAIPGVDDLPKPKLSRFTHANRHLVKNHSIDSGYRPPSSIRGMQNEGMPSMPSGYGKQKLQEIANAYGSEIAAKQGSYLMGVNLHDMENL